MRPSSAPRSPKAGEAKRIKLNSSIVTADKKQAGASLKVAGPRARALDLVKRHCPEHLDTAKKTKWIVDLVQGIMSDHAAALEAAQTQHEADTAAAKQETADAVAESMESAAALKQAQEETSSVQQALDAAKSEVEAGKVALEQAEMAAVVAATECMNMQKVAQAGSQGDKKARRVLSLRAHNLKENLLKAKTDLKAHKATARQQAFQIEVMNREQAAAAAAASLMTEQLAQQQAAAKLALKQSRSQSRLYQTKSVAAEPASVIPAVHPSVVDKAARMQSAMSPVASPSKPSAQGWSPARPATARGKGSGADAVCAEPQAQASHPISHIQTEPINARMSAWGDAGVFFGSDPFPQPQPVQANPKTKSKAVHA